MNQDITGESNMNSSNRSNNLRSSAPYARHMGSSTHQGRQNHQPRWPVNHIPFSKEYQQCFGQVNGDHDKDIYGYPKPHGTQSPPLFPTEASNPTDIRQLTPPLHLPHRSQVSESPVQIRGGPLLSISPTLLAATPIDTQVSLDFSPRRTAHQSSHLSDLRHSPIQSTVPYFRNNVPDESRKSESPSRKRRRVVQTPPPPPIPGAISHHAHLPTHTRSPWENRRSHRHQQARGSPPMRRQRFRDWVPEPLPLPRLQHTHTATFTHHPHAHASVHQPAAHHQPPLMMDVAQVPVSLPLPLYSGGPTPPPHLPSCQVHSIYCTAPPQHTCQIYDNITGFAGCLSHHHGATGHHHHHHGGAAGGGGGGGGGLGFLSSPPHAHSPPTPALPPPPPPAAAAAAALVHTIHHYPAPPPPPPPPPTAHHPHPDSIELDIIVDHHHHHHHHHHHRSPPHPTLLQVSTPSNIFISEVPRRTSPRRWRSPIPPNTNPFPGWLHFLAMFSNPPLSPYSQDLSSPESQQTENYEELLSLAERLGEAKPRGLNKMEIDQLPSFKFNSETHTGDQTSCVVCMCDFEPRQILRGLPCSHQFHAKCVDKWLKSNRTCPICRGDASGYFSNTD